MKRLSLMLRSYRKNIWGATINNTKEKYTIQTLEWLNKQKNDSIKTAIERWPDDYKFIAESAFWLEQITDAVLANPPKDNVRRMIVNESLLGNVIGVEYEYYKKGDPAIGKIAFRITTVSD